MTPEITVLPPVSGTTDLERRVLAQERILQSLIAYMARTEPRFVDHLRNRFVEPMAMARREHDYRDADDYAEEFVRAVMRLGETRTAGAPDTGKVVESARLSVEWLSPSHPPEPVPQPDRVQLKERNGVWEVRVDGVFRGDYHQKEHALAAMTLVRLPHSMNGRAIS